MNLALFDFDGTITRSDTYTSFLRFALSSSPRRLRHATLAPVALAYKAGIVAARRARPIASHLVFSGLRADFVRTLGHRYVAETLSTVIRRQALEQIAWHLAQGDAVVVVSASLDAYVQPWCKSLGIECICTELEERDGVLSGRYRYGDCSGRSKVRRILERYDPREYSVVFAYGDTLEDREMLDLAHRKFYRWKEITDWREVSARDQSHPRERASTGVE
jgi:phosphatidylglycerophosphatase C